MRSHNACTMIFKLGLDEVCGFLHESLEEANQGDTDGNPNATRSFPLHRFNQLLATSWSVGVFST